MNGTHSSVSTADLSFYQQYIYLSKLNEFVAATYFLAAFLGIPLNLYVATTIIREQRLHSPRNLMWLGVGFANTFHFFFYVALITTDSFMNPKTLVHSVALSIIGALAGLPEISLIMFLILSLLERHACLAHASWHKAVVTKGFVIKVQTGSFGILCLATKIHHIAGGIPFRWSTDSSDVELSLSFALGFLILCVPLQAIVGSKANRLYPPAGMPSFKAKKPSQHDPECYPSSLQTSDVISSNPQTSIQQELQEDHTSNFVLVDGNRMSQMDLQAARNVTASVKAFLCFSFPPLVVFLTLIPCFHLDLRNEATCFALCFTFFYLRCLPVAYSALFNPIHFVFNRRDVKASVLRGKF